MSSKFYRKVFGFATPLHIALDIAKLLGLAALAVGFFIALGMLIGVIGQQRADSYENLTGKKVDPIDLMMHEDKIIIVQPAK
jgi:hypothetical protein